MSASTASARRSGKKKERRKVLKGVAHIQASFNNTIVSITDPHGNLLTASSAGACGFRGSRKSTPHAAKVASSTAATKAKDLYGLEAVSVRICGAGPGREYAIRGLMMLDITELADVTPIPHNGCRDESERRV